MTLNPSKLIEMPDRRRRLIDAAVKLILQNGYSATTVDQICAEAGVTKGSFFHYFVSKDELARAAMDAWADGWEAILATAKLGEIADPLERLVRLFDVMGGAYLCTDTDAGCVVGTIAQEQAFANEVFRSHCYGLFDRWTQPVIGLLSDAKAAYPPKTDFDPVEVAWWLQSLVQGSMIMSKARGDRDVIASNLRHCRAYVMGLFGRYGPSNQSLTTKRDASGAVERSPS